MKQSAAPPSSRFWKIDCNMLKEASEVRKRDPKDRVKNGVNPTLESIMAEIMPF
jgi:hypothetical protein